MTVYDLIKGQYRSLFYELLINAVAKIAYDVSNDSGHKDYESRLRWANGANSNPDVYARALQLYVAHYISTLYEGDVVVLNQTNVINAVSATIDKVITTA